MTKKQKKQIIRMVVSALLLIAAATVPMPSNARPMAYLLVYALIGWDIVVKAVRSLFYGQALDENFLMTLAGIGAFWTGEYPESVLVMLLYQVGEWFQSYAVGKSRKSIASLMEIRPDSVRIERDGVWIQLAPEEAKVDEVFMLYPGERVPLDGIVIEGSSALDTTAMTGEAVPRDITEGDEIISGCVNLSGVLKVCISRPYAESTVSKVLELVENASSRKAKAENFITKFARYYTPMVVGAAVLLALVPGIISGNFAFWLYRAMVFLVISCPCALVISVPLTFFGGIGGASRCGILIKGSNYMEVLARVDTVAFDKTGTLTQGVFQVKAIHPQKGTKEQLLEYAATAEAFSNHPIADSIRRAYGKEIRREAIGQTEERVGRGLCVTAEGKQIAIGNELLMREVGADVRACHRNGTVVHVAVDGEYIGHLVIADEVKPEAAAAIGDLKKLGVETIGMLTGDRRAVGEQISEELGLDFAYTELLPADKVRCVEELLKKQKKGKSVAFVGDGINDAPVLSRADLGIAMGMMGSDAAIEAADVVLMDDHIQKVADAIRIARKTLRIVKQNIVFVLLVKFTFLALGAFGLANMWEAVFADVGVCILAILNASRTLRTQR